MNTYLSLSTTENQRGRGARRDADWIYLSESSIFERLVNRGGQDSVTGGVRMALTGRWIDLLTARDGPTKVRQAVHTSEAFLSARRCDIIACSIFHLNKMPVSAGQLPFALLRNLWAGKSRWVRRFAKSALLRIIAGVN